MVSYTRSGIYSVLSLMFLSLVILSGSGCTNTKKIVYFNDIADSASLKTINIADYTEVKLKPGDILQITVQTIDAKSTEIFSTQGSMAAGNVSGYIVDKEGYIEMPLVGRLKVWGLTVNETKELIREKAYKYYKEPVINVRLANFEITVLGEANRPGTIIMPRDKMGLVDAIGLAGDLSPFGRRDNILLIREDNGKKTFVRFDLNSADIFRSPYYYVRPGDIIYIEPNTVKAKNTTVDYSRDRYINYGVTAISLVIAIISFVRLNN